MCVVIFCLIYFSPQHENVYASERKDTTKLPQNRSTPLTDTLDDVTSASQGHVTARDVVEIFNRQQANDKQWDAAKVADVYKLSQVDAENLLKYFSNYTVVATYSREPKPEMKFHNVTE